MGLLRNLLGRIVVVQKRFTIPLFIITILFTAFMAVGLTKVTLETDFNKMLPQDIPIMQLNERIRDTFSGQDQMIIILTLDEESNAKNALRDIRDPGVIEYMILLEDDLGSESEIIGVISPGTYMKGIPLTSPETVKQLIMNSPAQEFVSRDFKTAVMFIAADVGSSDERTIALDNLIRDKVRSFSVPSGVEVLVTGSPQVRVTVFDLLGQDAVNTILYASVIIIVLLFIIQRSFSKGVLVFAPLVLGLIWTYGTLGWLDIKLSIATAGLGAIILGLGVEYGVFMVTRYREERDHGKDQMKALKKAVPSIGSAIIGSGTTTIVGFLALATAVIPMIQNLGLSLALGIFYALSATVFVLPVLIILEEAIEHRYTSLRHKKYSKKMEAIRRRGT